jgi:hypothetical protein
MRSTCSQVASSRASPHSTARSTGLTDGMPMTSKTTWYQPQTKPAATHYDITTNTQPLGEVTNVRSRRVTSGCSHSRSPTKRRMARAPGLTPAIVTVTGFPTVKPHARAPLARKQGRPRGQALRAGAPRQWSCGPSCCSVCSCATSGLWSCLTHHWSAICARKGRALRDMYMTPKYSMMTLGLTVPDKAL